MAGLFPPARESNSLPAPPNPYSLSHSLDPAQSQPPCGATPPFREPRQLILGLNGHTDYSSRARIVVLTANFFPLTFVNLML